MSECDFCGDDKLFDYLIDCEVAILLDPYDLVDRKIKVALCDKCISRIKGETESPELLEEKV